MDETLIVVSIITMLGSISIVEILNSNWFKRERFKLETSNIRKQNDLQIKKMARDLGLSATKTIVEPAEKKTGSGLAAAILPELIKNMDPDTLANIATNLIGGYGGGEIEGAEGSEGGMDMITDFIANNPDIVKSFLGGVKNAKKEEAFTGQM